MRPYRSQFRALTEGLYALRKGTYVPNLNFRYGSFSFWGVGHVPVGILPIFMSLLPFHLSYVAVSRPCCLSEFYPSRAFRMGIGIYSGGERGQQGTVLTSLQHSSNEQVAHQHKHLMCHDCGCRRSCQQVSNTKKINGCHFISLINYWALACVTLQENIEGDIHAKFFRALSFACYVYYYSAKNLQKLQWNYETSLAAYSASWGQPHGFSWRAWNFVPFA